MAAIAEPTVRPRFHISTIAADSHGYVTIGDLREQGITKSQLQTMVRRGTVIAVGRGLYAVGYEARTDEGRWAKAVGAYGSGAALDEWSAAQAWGYVNHGPGLPAVVVPTRRRRRPCGAVSVESRMDDSWTTMHRGIPILTPTRTIVRVARSGRPERVVRVMREAAYRGQLDVDQLLDILEREAGRPGMPNLARAMSLRATGSAGARSALELRVLDHLARSWSVAPRYNVKPRRGARHHEVDLVWDEFRICAEIDGPIHDEPDVRRTDMERDARLREDGWDVHRIHWDAFGSNPAAATVSLLDAVNRAAAERALTARSH